MLLSRHDPLLPILKDQGVLCYVMDTNPTAEAIAKAIFDCGQAAGFPVVEVSIWETESSFATYGRR
jgi:6-pyruvoyltetrahydropterin/6-carboxytetrahydropterin synthase